MNKSLLLGLWKFLLPLPRPVWQSEVERSAQHSRARLAALTPDHHKVRDWVVLNLPKFGTPLAPEVIANNVGLPLPRTIELLDELEKGMTYLYRNGSGAVDWAYPVTVEPTPHHLEFSTGEQVYAA